MFGYKAFYKGKSVEVYADSLYAAKQKAIASLNVRASQVHLVAVILCEKDGETVTHSTAEI